MTINHTNTMIDKNLIDAAKLELDRLKMSPADRELSMKYPRHTLAAARLIDATPIARGITGCRCAFDLIRLQETANFHITEDHT